jgi:hypothetical protein
MEDQMKLKVGRRLTRLDQCLKDWIDDPHREPKLVELFTSTVVKPIAVTCWKEAVWKDNATVESSVDVPPPPSDPAMSDEDLGRLLEYNRTN